MIPPEPSLVPSTSHDRAPRRSQWICLGAVVALVGTALSVAAQDCMRWTLRTDVGDPGPQARHAMAYHRDRGTTCLVSSGVRPDVWEYDGRRWTQVIVDGPVPMARQDAGLVYDPVRKVLLLVGGLGRPPGALELPPILVSDDQPLADVWAFHFTGDGRGFWSRQADLPLDGRLEPGRRIDPQLVFDNASGRVILYGATARGFHGWVADTDLLVWDGATWTRIGLPNDANVTQNALAYDSRRRRVLSYGGLFDRFDAIEDDRVWAAHGRLSVVSAAPALQTLATGPQRLGHRMVFDSRRDRVVVFGGAYLEGSTSLSERPTRLYATPHLEFLLGKEPVTIVNPVLPGPSPEPRSYHGLVYDERRGVTVLYGGLGTSILGSGPSMTNTWELGPAALRITRQPPTHVDTCMDINTGTFLSPPIDVSVEVESTTFVRYQWRRQGEPIENPIARVPRLQVNAFNFDWMNAWGYYDVVVSTECGSEVVSTPVEVRVYGNPAVTRQPATRRVCPGEPVEATTDGVAQYRTSQSPDAPRHDLVIRQDPTRPIHYAWERVPADSQGDPIVGRGTPIPGATSPTLRLPAMSPSDSGYYRCVLTDGCGRGRTDEIELTAGVWIRRQPRSLTNDVCLPASLAVAASGKGTVRYRWRRHREPLADNDRISGTTSSELRIRSLRYLDDAEYDCVITDDCHSVTSRVAAISVRPNPPFLQVDSSGPAPRARGALVYDATRGVTVLFGGLGDGRTVGEAYRNDTWEYDGTRWTERISSNPDPNTTSAPSGRSDFGMAFDRVRSRVVLFGGFTHDGVSSGRRSGETWEYDGTEWTRKNPVRSPAPRNGCTLFYDPIRKVTTLYGGDTELANPRAGDLWNWDGESWTPVEVTGPRPLFGGTLGSPPRPQMVWSDAHGHAVLPPVVRTDGGGLDRATWTWDGVRWTEHPYAFAGFGNSPAQTGSGMGLVYDPFRREVVYWSGDATDQEFLWRWNGTGWRRDDIGPVVGWHLHAHAAYDERRNSIVQFGGSYAGNDPSLRGLSRITFERLLADEPVLLRQPSVENDPTTGARRIRLVAAGAPPLAYEWQRDGVRLTPGPSLSGLTNSTLVLEGSWTNAPGSFRCVVRGRCGEVTSAAVSLVERPSGTLVLTTLSRPVGATPDLVLEWSEPGAILEFAATPDGPWTLVPGAASPHSPKLQGAAGFYRLRVP